MSCNTKPAVAAFVALLVPLALGARQPERWMTVGAEVGTEVELDTASLTEIEPDIFEAWRRRRYAASPGVPPPSLAQYSI